MAVFRAAGRCLSSLLMLAAVSSAEAVEATKVVVTIKPVHSLVSQVMEGVGVPSLLVEGAASPHTFTLKPSTAQAINEADVFIRVSDALEPFTRNIVRSLPGTVAVLTLVEAPGINLLEQRRGGTFERHEHTHLPPHPMDDAGGAARQAEHDDDDDGAESKDGHIWLDPQNAKAIVAVVARTLATRYPDHAGKFAANAMALEQRIDALEGELAAELKGVQGKSFIVFHDATQYFEKHFGLAAAGSITVSPDVPPSARRLMDVRHKIASLGAVCVFSEPSFQPNLVAAVTEGTAARSGILDAEGQMLEPGADLYFTLMRGLARNLARCLSAQG